MNALSLAKYMKIGSCGYWLPLNAMLVDAHVVLATGNSVVHLRLETVLSTCDWKQCCPLATGNSVVHLRLETVLSICNRKQCCSFATGNSVVRLRLETVLSTCDWKQCCPLATGNSVVHLRLETVLFICCVSSGRWSRIPGCRVAVTC